MTGGDSSYSIELNHYDPVPPAQQEQMVAQYRKQGEAATP
jgi:elongation factor G